MSEKTFRIEVIVTEVAGGREVTRCTDECTFDPSELFLSRMCHGVVYTALHVPFDWVRGRIVEPIVDEVFSR